MLKTAFIAPSLDIYSINTYTYTYAYIHLILPSVSKI